MTVGCQSIIELNVCQLAMCYRHKAHSVNFNLICTLNQHWTMLTCFMDSSPLSVNIEDTFTFRTWFRIWFIGTDKSTCAAYTRHFQRHLVTARSDEIGAPIPDGILHGSFIWTVVNKRFTSWQRKSALWNASPICRRVCLLTLKSVCSYIHLEAILCQRSDS